MKKIVKKHKFLIVIILLLCLYFLYCVIKYNISYNKMVSDVNRIIVGIADGTLEPLGNNFNPQIPVKTDAISLFFSILNSDFRFLISILPLFILLPSCYNFYQKMKSGIIRSEIVRQNYNQYIKQNIIETYRSILIIPIFLIISFLISFLVCGRLDIWNKYDNIFAYQMENPLDQEYILILPVFWILYIVNHILLSGYYINVTLVFIRKRMPYLVSCVASFLVILGISVFLEIVIGKWLLELLFGIKGMNATFNSFCFWIPGDHSNIYIQFLISLFLFIASSFLVHIYYKNKEKVLIENEL